MNPLATLLHKANSSPPWEFKKDFYELKQRILQRFGTPDGHDVQHIPGKECYGCDGTGIFKYSEYDTCERCYGSGWYKQPVWVVLRRYRFGRYVFHSPESRSYTRPDPDITRIHGYVEHARYPGRQHDLAFAWLCLLFGRWGLFWRWLGSSRPCGFQRHPFLIARQVVCTVRWKLHDLRARCNRCRRHVWASNILICDRCTRTDGLPF